MQEGEKIQANKKTEKTFDKKKLALILGGAVLIIFLFIFIFLSVKAAAYDKVLPNVTAGGVNIGGMSKERAAVKLEAELKKNLDNKVYTLILEEKKQDFTAEEIGLEADIEKTVERAYSYGKQGSIFKKIKEYLKSKNNVFEVEVAADVDDEKISSILDKIADGKEAPVTETEYKVSKDILTIINGHEGITLNREKAKKAVKDGIFSSNDNSIELALEPAKPKKVNVDELYNEITSGQRNAEYVRENGAIVVKDGFPKVEMDKADLKAAIDSGKRTYDIKVKVTQPEITGEELKGKLFRDKMGSWSTNFSGSNVSRASNVKLSAERINGVTLLPGETFSYDSTIGKRTAANGYKTATVYVGNKEEAGIGGGICQTSSTLYSAVLYANLEIVSRTSHSLPVSYVPAGQDATIAEGYIDFVFKNNTDYPVKIVAETTYGSITCSIYGVKNQGESVQIVNTRTSTLQPGITRETDAGIPVGYKKVTKKGVPGYTVSSQRVVSVNGVVQKTEKLTNSTYRAQDTIEVVNPADKNTSSENLKNYDPKTYRPPAETTPANGEGVPSVDVPDDGTAGQNPGEEDVQSTESAA